MRRTLMPLTWLRGLRRAAAAAALSIGVIGAAVAQTMPETGPGDPEAAIDCLWAGLDPALQTSTTAGSHFVNAGMWEDVSQSIILVRMDIAGSATGETLTLESLAACAVPKTTDAHFLAVLALVARASRTAAEAQLARIGGEPRSVELAFNKLLARRRADLVNWAITGTTDNSERTTYNFWTAIERTRLNRTYTQQRIVSLGLFARLVEFEATRCLGERGESHNQCVQRLAGNFAEPPQSQKGR